MKTPKQQALELLERLPDDAPMNTVLAEIHFIASVQRGVEDAQRGDVVTQDEVRLRLNKWLASSGHEKLSGT